MPAGYAPKSTASDPSDWQELTDPSSGKFYYYNAKTGVTQWDKPEGFKSENDVKEPVSTPTPAATSTPQTTSRPTQNENVPATRTAEVGFHIILRHYVNIIRLNSFMLFTFFLDAADN